MKLLDIIHLSMPLWCGNTEMGKFQSLAATGTLVYLMPETYHKQNGLAIPIPGNRNGLATRMRSAAAATGIFEEQPWFFPAQSRRMAYRAQPWLRLPKDRPRTRHH